MHFSITDPFRTRHSGGMDRWLASWLAVFPRNCEDVIATTTARVSKNVRLEAGGRRTTNSMARFSSRSTPTCHNIFLYSAKYAPRRLLV